MKASRKAALRGLLGILAGGILAVGAAWGAVTVTVPLATGDAQQYGVALGEKWVAWVLEERGEEFISVADWNGPAKKLPVPAARRQGLTLDGDNLFWADRGAGNWDIFQYDLASGEVRRLTVTDADQQNPSASGGRVAWQEDRDGDYDIYLYDLASKQGRYVASNNKDQMQPALDGNTLVWREVDNYKGDIHVYDIATGQTRQLTRDDADQDNPAVSGSWVVWQDDRNDNWDIYGYNLATGKEVRISTGEGNQQFPSLSGSVVVWQDDRNGNWDIYGYNLATGKEFPVYTGEKDQTRPVIHGNRVAWVDARDGNQDVYYTTIEGNEIAPPGGNVKPPEPEAPSTPASPATPAGPGEQELAALPGIKVVVGGKLVAFDQPPVMEAGRVLVPFRKVAEALGATVEWDSAARQVTMRKADRTVSLRIGDPQALVNGRAVQLDVPGKVLGGRTLVPLRFVGEALGLAVDWNGQLQAAFLR